MKQHAHYKKTKTKTQASKSWPLHQKVAQKKRKEETDVCSSIQNSKHIHIIRQRHNKHTQTVSVILAAVVSLQ